MRRPRPAGGFTLVELLVVLVIAGVLASVAMPNLVRLYESMQNRLAEESILLQLTRLPQQALVEETSYLILSQSDTRAEETRNRYPDYTLHELELPEGWGFTLQAPLRVKSVGICLGGEMTLYRRGERIRTLSLEAPKCQLAD